MEPIEAIFPYQHMQTDPALIDSRSAGQLTHWHVESGDDTEGSQRKAHGDETKRNAEAHAHSDASEGDLDGQTKEQWSDSNDGVPWACPEGHDKHGSSCINMSGTSPVCATVAETQQSRPL